MKELQKAIAPTIITGLLDKCYDFVRADDLKSKGIYPYFNAIEESEGPVVQMQGREVIMVGSNNYLGLTTHPKVQEAAIKAIEKFGTSCSGSRYLTGTISLHEELETRLAQFVGKEAALLFSTGYQTAQGVIQPLIGRGDYLLSDRDNHASIVAGNLMARGGSNANVLRYRHNDMEHLERQLKRIPIEAGKLIVTDGVFSTFGAIAALDEIVALAKQYNATVLIDDAHALGVIGKNGQGTASYFDVTDDVDLIMCTFSKTLASLGGFVAGEERVINYLKHQSSALIFSASPTPASVGAALAALEVLEEEPYRVVQLQKNGAYLRKGLQQLGYKVMEGETAIVPVHIGDDNLAFKLWKGLFDNQVFTNVFVAPATPPNKAMLRNSVMATHRKEHLDRVIEVYKIIGQREGLIG